MLAEQRGFRVWQLPAVGGGKLLILLKRADQQLYGVVRRWHCVLGHANDDVASSLLRGPSAGAAVVEILLPDFQQADAGIGGLMPPPDDV